MPLPDRKRPLPARGSGSETPSSSKRLKMPLTPSDSTCALPLIPLKETIKIDTIKQNGQSFEDFPSRWVAGQSFEDFPSRWIAWF
ncbi:hypothetical protein MRB53_006759 [Persea americana]|uniref:Uncharacterized protein n=1 Tax=Persea americana TaxID=3435 RepID=A0ACC2MGW2_PERAE|nr:hypothetical protein MRB53_006759 [Persea americana]